MDSKARGAPDLQGAGRNRGLTGRIRTGGPGPLRAGVGPGQRPHIKVYAPACTHPTPRGARRLTGHPFLPRGVGHPHGEAQRQTLWSTRTEKNASRGCPGELARLAAGWNMGDLCACAHGRPSPDCPDPRFICDSGRACARVRELALHSQFWARLRQNARTALQLRSWRTCARIRGFALNLRR